MSACIAFSTAERTIPTFWEAYSKMMPACTDVHRLDAWSSVAVGVLIFTELSRGLCEAVSRQGKNR